MEVAAAAAVVTAVTDGCDKNEGRPCPPEPIKDRAKFPSRRRLLSKSLTNSAFRLARQQRRRRAPPRDGDDANDDCPCQSPCQQRGRRKMMDPISSRPFWTNSESRFDRHGRARVRPTAREGDDRRDGSRCPPGRSPSICRNYPNHHRSTIAIPRFPNPSRVLSRSTSLEFRFGPRR